MFPIKNYLKASSVKEAVDMLVANPNSCPIAGGTDILIRLHEGKSGYESLIDIHDLEELKQCRINENGSLSIGTGMTFSALMTSEEIQAHIPILAIAAGTVGGPQVRNTATIGGNICNGVTSADSATSLFCHNATLNIISKNGNRTLPIEEFYLGPGKVDLKSDEIVTSFEISQDNYQGYLGHYHKYAMRNAMDIATIGCAAVCKIEDDHLMDLRLAYGVAAPVPIRCKQTESRVIGEKLTPKLMDDIAKSVLDDVNPRTSWRASKEFRLQIIQELARRVVKQAIEKAGGKIQ